MATLFDYLRHIWRNGVDGGTSITAEKLNEMEDALYNQNVVLADVLGRLGNLESGGTNAVIASALAAADRGTPSLFRVNFPPDSHVPEWGDGTAWRTFAGGTVAAGGGGTGSGGTGTTGAPQNPFARTLPDNTMETGCDTTGAPSGATWNLYGDRQTAALVTGLSTPYSLRNPGGTGTYGYRWTWTSGGVESAPSAWAYTAKPYGTSVDPNTGAATGSGGTTAGSPADLLNLGGIAGRWSIDVGYASGNKSYDADTVEADLSIPNFFYSLDDGSGVAFRTQVNGGTTPNSTYPRVELRERNADGSLASWDASKGSHSLALTLKASHLPVAKPELVGAQMHNSSDDTIQVRLEGTTWKLSINGELVDDPLMTGYSLDTYFALLLQLTSGRLSAKVNGTEKWNGKPGFGAGNYWKFGDYVQSNTSKEGSTTPYGLVVVKTGTVAVSHSS